MVATKTREFGMNPDLEPITRTRLLDFGRRQAQFRMLRGLSAAVSIATSVILVATFVDGLWLLATWQRWILSLWVYAIILVASWTWCRPRMFKPASLTDVAKAFETADARLQDQLLAAVELSDDNPSCSSSSPAFRARLQQQVARSIVASDVALLLPWQLIRTWLVLAGITLFIVTLLSCLPSLHFPQRVARALLPAANLARHSRVSLEIIQPDPHSQVVAMGDMVRLQVAQTGPLPSTIFVEMRCDQQPLRSQVMHVLAPSQLLDDTGLPITIRRPQTRTFYTHLAISSKVTEYRVVADDAATSWYRLVAVPRPQTVTIRKRITSPSYMQRADEFLEGDDGHLEAYQGTTVQLTVCCDQLLAQAEMHWQWATGTGTPAKTTISRMDVDGMNATVQFPLIEDGFYRLHIKAKETGLTNTYSPQYTVRVLKDSPPSIRWTQPDRPNLIVKSDTILDLSAHVEDDMPLAHIKQQVQVNSGEWNEFDLDSPTDPVSAIRWNQDLASMQLKPGDLVHTKLVATDRKGQASHTPDLELVVSNADLIAHPDERLLIRRVVADQLRQFTENCERVYTKLQAQRTQQSKENSIGVASKRFVQEAHQGTLELREEVRLVHQTFLGAIGKLKDAVSLSELERVAHVLSNLQHQHLRSLESITQAASMDSESKTSEVLEAFSKIQKTSRDLDTRFRQFHTHDILAAIGRDFAQLNAGQRNLVERQSKLTEEQIRREQSVLGKHFRELERLMIEQLPILEGSPARQLEQWSLWFANHAEFIEQGTQERSSKERLDRLAETVLQQLTLRPQISTIDVQLPAQLTIGHRELADLGGMLNPKLQTDAPLEQITDRRAIHQQRVDADRVFASDLGNVLRAFKELNHKPELETTEVITRKRTIAEALGKLEAIHDVNDAGQILAGLMIAERWETDTLDATLENPRQWDGWVGAVDQSLLTLRSVNVPKELLAELANLKELPSFSSASQTITSRRWSTEPTRSAAKDLERLHLKLTQVLRKLDVIAHQARAVIANHAPKLATLAQRAIASTRALRDETKELEEGLAKQEIPNGQQRVEQLQEQQQTASVPMAELREALQDLASAQNILDRNQLERARDADTAAAIMHEAEDTMREAMQAAVDAAASSKAAVEKLNDAAQQQQQMIDTLEQIAVHFGESSSDSKLAGTLAQQQRSWEQLVEQMRSAALQSEYADAAKLAEMAATKPQTLLEKLEQEAKRNLPMREELSEIARAAAAESLRMLEQAADNERSLRIGLETSDPSFLSAKHLLHDSLTAAVDRATQTLDTLIAEAGSAATHLNDVEITSQFEQLQQQMKQITAQSRLAKGQHSHEETVVAAKNFDGVLRDIQQSLESVSADLRTKSQSPVHASEQELRNRRREIEERQRRVRILQARDMQQALRAEELRFNQNENALRSTNQATAQALAKRETSKEPASHSKQLSKEPSDSQDVPLVVKQLEEQLAVLQANRVLLQQQIDAALTAKRLHDNEQAPVPLDAPNPTAQLASQFAEQAAKDIEKITSNLKGHTDTTRMPDTLRAAASRLEATVPEQQAVEQAVIEASENLARAARHEERTQHVTRQRQLARQSEQVAATASNELHLASDKLVQTFEQAQRNVDDAFLRASAEATHDARNALQNAEDVLRKRITELGALLAAGSPQTSQESAGSEQPGDNSGDAGGNSPMEPSRLARLLDELDRQINERMGGPSSNPPGATNATQNSQSPSLAQAAQQLAAKMNQQRQNQNNHAAESGSETSMSRASSNPAAATSVQLLNVNRLEKTDWGKLRQQTAEDIVESARESVAPRYRKQVETYFRVLAEQGTDHNSQESLKP